MVVGYMNMMGYDFMLKYINKYWKVYIKMVKLKDDMICNYYCDVHIDKI